MAERIDYLNSDPFLNGPAILVAKIAAAIADVTQFEGLFGSAIDAYKRTDYQVRAFPALRIYNEGYRKEFDSWFIDGDINIDVILPAALRRNLIQSIQDTVSSALLQQFRRPTFFADLCTEIPGLNELGKTFSVTKNMEFEFDGDYCPAMQITVNFRIDLRQWDNYLESEYLTKDEPFAETLADLELIVAEIKALEDDLITENIAISAEIDTTT
jgi:hypothetical protein